MIEINGPLTSKITKRTILSETARIFDLFRLILRSCSSLCEATLETLAVVSWTNQCPKLFILNSRSIYLILSHWNKLPFRDPYKQRLYSGIIWILRRFRKNLECLHIFASFRIVYYVQNCMLFPLKQLVCHVWNYMELYAIRIGK